MTSTTEILVAGFIWDLSDAFWLFFVGSFVVYVVSALAYFAFRAYVVDPIWAWWRRGRK